MNVMSVDDRVAKLTAECGLFIAGAGLSGLIAARMLQDRSPIIFDAAQDVPNNHRALLRFRDESVSQATNIPFKQVRVLKEVYKGDRYGSAVADAVRYSIKVTGKLQTRSVLDLDPVVRYVAPDDFIPRLARGADFLGGRSIEHHLDQVASYHGLRVKPIISTVPMPVMMDIFAWPNSKRPKFTSIEGWNMRFRLPPELDSTFCATIYCPDPKVPWYRASITNSDVIVEGVGEAPDQLSDAPSDIAESVLWAFGLNDRFGPQDFDEIVLSKAKYQKIGNVSGNDMELAKRFIIFLTEQHGIYSLGRFATWRPKLLLDDVIKDVRVIAALLDGGSGYDLRKPKEI